MSRDKQIEKMAFNLIMATSPLGVKDLTKQFDYITVATDLYELYSWRKASEVAREIFEEISKVINEWGTLAEQDNSSYAELMELVLSDIATSIDELKKKYESEKDNG